MNKRFSAGGAVLSFMLISASQAFADDKPLIWQPLKNSDTSYAVKLGVKLPVAMEPQAGFVLGVDAQKNGTVVDTPVKFWSSFKAESIQRPAYEMNRKVAFDLDSLAESAGISVNYYEKQIVTPALDLERQSSYELRYDGLSQQWSGFDASQSVKLSRSNTGTAVVVRANTIDNFKIAGAGLGLEQKFGDHITLTGSFDGSTAATDPVASINARYAFTW
ncbi:hypothetical protein [Neorhizobium alkalisoli]|uniref:Uncharacterized protein n=1 Tax=Neorhizobium alkalisoli TaxID=528178 RepID=A0A561QHL3_9HYPH|nr:hypothetical protein [Neorhizobium alkalisoli]TWF49875.1 hypothetical protein FHW37_107242 [Neorhizobium alkalisoli]